MRLRVPVLAVPAPDGGVGVPDSTELTAASCSCPLPKALGAGSTSALRWYSVQLLRFLQVRWSFRGASLPWDVKTSWLLWL